MFPLIKLVDLRGVQPGDRGGCSAGWKSACTFMYVCMFVCDTQWCLVTRKIRALLVMVKQDVWRAVTS